MLHRGPTDQDQKPTLRCSICRELRPCYRTRLLGVSTNLLGTFERWEWLCEESCFPAKVMEGLRRSGLV